MLESIGEPALLHHQRPLPDVGDGGDGLSVTTPRASARGTAVQVGSLKRRAQNTNNSCGSTGMRARCGA